MAKNSIRDPIEIQSSRIDATLLPKEFSQPYRLYVIQQGKDFGKIADKANHAGDIAYDALAKNEAQDIEIAEHGKRIAVNADNIREAEDRLKTSEEKLVFLTSDINHQGQRLNSIKQDYVSKSAMTAQTLAGSLSVKSSLSVNGSQVVGPQQTGWTQSSGSANKSAFNADQNYNVGATYSQSEVQTLISALIETRQRVKALEDMAANHGLIAYGN